MPPPPPTKTISMNESRMRAAILRGYGLRETAISKKLRKSSTRDVRFVDRPTASDSARNNGYCKWCKDPMAGHSRKGCVKADFELYQNVRDIEKYALHGITIPDMVMDKLASPLARIQLKETAVSNLNRWYAENDSNEDFLTCFDDLKIHVGGDIFNEVRRLTRLYATPFALMGRPEHLFVQSDAHTSRWYDNVLMANARSMREDSDKQRMQDLTNCLEHSSVDCKVYGVHTFTLSGGKYVDAAKLQPVSKKIFPSSYRDQPDRIRVGFVDFDQRGVPEAISESEMFPFYEVRMDMLAHKASVDASVDLLFDTLISAGVKYVAIGEFA